MEVQILSRKLIKPLISTPTHLRIFNLSLFDQLTPRAYINIIIYYSASDKGSEDHKSAILEKSLPKALTKFYPLAGRLVKEDHIVDCNDKGVEFLEARVEGQLAQLLQESGIGLLNQLVPWDLDPPDSVTSPLVAIQINNFNCGGLVVGLRVSHKAVDASTASAFINEWARTSREEISETLPSFGLASLFPPRSLSGFKTPPPTKIGSMIITKRYVFDGTTISKLKAKAAKSQPTRVVAVMALVWKALIGVSRAKHGHLRPSLLAHPINLRGKTNLPISENSFGNLFMVNTVQFRGDESKIELHDLMGLIEDSITHATTSLKIKNNDEVSLTGMNKFGEVIEGRLNLDKVDLHIFTIWCRFPIYEADFGWGRPCWVSGLGRPFEMVSLIDNRGGDGIEAWVSLNEENMVQFERELRDFRHENLLEVH